jgi:hypothetical protein
MSWFFQCSLSLFKPRIPVGSNGLSQDVGKSSAQRLTMLLLYAYCAGTVSSRKIERACYEDLAFRALTANQQPDHIRIGEFRRRNLDALKG